MWCVQMNTQAAAVRFHISPAAAWYTRDDSVGSDGFRISGIDGDGDGDTIDGDDTTNVLFDSANDYTIQLPKRHRSGSFISRYG